jgi:nitroimidazol reductase NimA-like FMN-containing flavoprotein (pyridoxamine 5'-phosphate oxidase superfamily)
MNNEALPEEILPMLRVHGFGVLATSGGEYPHTSLISLEFSPDCRSLVFSTLRETRKYANLLREARVSVLLDNRPTGAQDPANLYAMTLFGVAEEVEETNRAPLRQHLLRRHPQLEDFLSLAQTALVQVIFQKIVLVEGLQKIRTFLLCQD